MKILEFIDSTFQTISTCGSRSIDNISGTIALTSDHLGNFLLLLSRWSQLSVKSWCLPKIRYVSSQGCIKFPAIWFSFPPSYLENLIFFPEIAVPFPSSPLDNPPYNFNILEQMILLPLPLFSMWYSSPGPKAHKLPSPLHNFPKGGE